MLGSVTVDLDPVDRGHSTVGGLGPRRLSWCMHVFLKISGVMATPMCLDSLRLPGYARTLQKIYIFHKSFESTYFAGSVPRGAQVPNFAVVDLAEGYQGVTVYSSCLVRQLETAGKMSGPHSPGHKIEAMPESSSHGQTNVTSHEIIGNFMTKMTEGERAQNISNDEALERFLRFWAPESHGEVEQENKVELFLEQLNDIYDTLQYEGARRLTFTAFRLRGAAKD
ncbi:hypothetical protein M9H77_19348 [Catharanthus roseus]|uniref:Uncharacterized protein n=1 Tax=Catharanthus roseus TaxID=4058 RepID=A0ACC0BA28_CATRO|nr:hypothetical protein M9H77_19348 [Catharanthus roseus]